MTDINPDFLEENWGIGSLQPSHTVVGRSSSLSISANNVATTASWNLIAIELGHRDFFDIGAPTIFTIPVGVTRVKLTAQLHLSTSSQDSHLNAVLFRNGSVALGWGDQAILSVFMRSGPLTVSANQVSIPVFEVVAGDTLSLVLKQPEGAARNMTTGSWFSIEDAS